MIDWISEAPSWVDAALQWPPLRYVNAAAAFIALTLWMRSWARDAALFDKKAHRIAGWSALREAVLCYGAIEAASMDVETGYRVGLFLLVTIGLISALLTQPEVKSRRATSEK